MREKSPDLNLPIISLSYMKSDINVLFSFKSMMLIIFLLTPRFFWLSSKINFIDSESMAKYLILIVCVLAFSYIVFLLNVLNLILTSFI